MVEVRAHRRGVVPIRSHYRKSRQIVASATAPQIVRVMSPRTVADLGLDENDLEDIERIDPLAFTMITYPARPIVLVRVPNEHEFDRLFKFPGARVPEDTVADTLSHETLHQVLANFHEPHPTHAGLDRRRLWNKRQGTQLGGL